MNKVIDSRTGDVVAFGDAHAARWGGNTKGERVAVDPEGPIDRNYLYSYKDRQRGIGLLRELIAEASESAQDARTAKLGGVGNRGLLAEGVDASLARLERLRERYVRELGDALRMQERIEAWIEDLSPRRRDLVRYRYLLDHTMEEAAEYFGISFSTVNRLERQIFSRT